MDDLFEKKKEVAEVLDLSRVVITSQEEFRRSFEKVPDFKVKVEKVIIIFTTYLMMYNLLLCINTSTINPYITVHLN